MRVGLLTLPLHNNYGGILQAYAMMNILKKRGHEVWLINFCHYRIPKWKWPLLIIKRVIGKILFKSNTVIFYERQQRRENVNIEKFISKYIHPKTSSIYIPHEIDKIKDYKFDLYIVGSDQVWRAEYNEKYINNYFLDFAIKSSKKCISYAASFGVDSWEYDELTTRKLQYFSQKFQAISVREDSAVDLCRKFLKVHAEFHLDPTFLLDIDDYLALIETEGTADNNGCLLTYLLDDSREKMNIVKAVSEICDLGIFSTGIRRMDQGGSYPSVMDWIDSFSRSNFVVTDSFHGCVFSILFNKPFIAIGNESRGMARFSSLLKLFNLQDRLIKSFSELTQNKVLAPVNWVQVNAILKSQKEKSLTFLKEQMLLYNGY